MNKSILDFFPHTSFRPQQENTLLEIERLYKSGVKNIMVNMPTGGGKSSIAFTVAAWSKSAFCVTPQKLLQDQYGRDIQDLGIDDITILKGKANYPCHLLDDKQCDACVLPLGKECEYKEDCFYYRAEDKALKTNTVVANYHVLHSLDRKMWGWSKQNIKTYQSLYKRNVLICDEAHSIEEFLMSQISVVIPDHEKKFNGVTITPHGIKTHLIETISNERGNLSRVETIATQLDEEREQDKAEKISRRITALKRQIGKLEHLLLKLDDRNWAFVPSYNSTRQYKGIEAKPIMVGQYSNMIFRTGDLKLFLSATLPTKRVFCKSLGLKPEETELIETKNTFPVNNRTTYFLSEHNAIPMTTKNINIHGPAGVYSTPFAVIENILRHCYDKKGVIITQSNRIMDELLEYSMRNNIGDRLIIARGETRGKAIEEHTNSSKPSILIGPNLYEGLDLKYELGRFCIIVKCPYPPEDAQIKARRAKDADWYSTQVALKLTQGLGRCCRAEDDWCMNFVIDPSIINFMLGRGIGFIPNYIKESLRPMPLCFLEGIE